MVLILLAMAADLITFALFIGPGTVELNPIMATAYARFGLVMVILLKAIVTATMLLLVLRTHGPKRRFAMALALAIPLIGVLGNVSAGLGTASAAEPYVWERPSEGQFHPVVVDATMAPADRAAATSSPARPVRVEAATIRPTQRPTAQPSAGTRSRSVASLGTPPRSGSATWYDDGPGLYAAVGSWTWGHPLYQLSVCTPSSCVTVTVRDFCRACADGRRIIDLSPAAFQQLAPLSAGVVWVTLR